MSGVLALVDTRPVFPSSTCAPLTLQQSLVTPSDTVWRNILRNVCWPYYYSPALPCVSQMCSLLEHFLNNCQPQVGLSTVITVLCTVSCVLCPVLCLVLCPVECPVQPQVGLSTVISVLCCVLCTIWLLVSKLRGFVG